MNLVSRNKVSQPCLTNPLRPGPQMHCRHTEKGKVSARGQHTTLRLTISPFAFLTFRSFIRKYQNRDLATTEFGAKMRMRYSFGVGLASVGK